MDNIIYLNMVNMERSHWWYKGRREIIGKLLAPYVRSGDKILDAGCGAGGTMEYMERYGSVAGVDISKEMIKHCRTMGLSAYQGSVESIPFEDGNFDVVLCLDVLEHLPQEQPALEELKRVVRPGGILIFSVPAFSWLWSRHDEQNNHFRRYNFSELNTLIKKADLLIERSTYFNFFLIPPIWGIRRLGFQNFMAKQSDFEIGSGGLNHILYQILKFERFLLSYINLPIGVSQIIISRKR